MVKRSAGVAGSAHLNKMPTDPIGKFGRIAYHFAADIDHVTLTTMTVISSCCGVFPTKSVMSAKMLSSIGSGARLFRPEITSRKWSNPSPNWRRLVIYSCFNAFVASTSLWATFDVIRRSSNPRDNLIRMKPFVV